MPRIFICYRRADSGGWVTAIYKELVQHFDPADIFRDISTIDYGVDFVEAIESAVQQCDVLLAVIGPHWKTITDEAGQRRLDDPNDFVRLEIEAALKRNIRVIPVLVGGASMPYVSELPAELQPLTRRQALPIEDRDFDPHVERLVHTLQGIQPTHSQPVAATPPEPRISPVLSILPPPFEWVTIPAGKVTLITEKGWDKNYIPEGQSKTFDVSSFAIAKYPVTNAQFAKFVEAGGYREPKWWTAAGWQQREQENWTAPRYYQNGWWNGTEQPVVGVSWYEALAFCRWLSAASDEPVMLPTEQQWQRSAQGDDGRQYPWGSQTPNEQLCNSERKFKRTTPVTHYPAGANQYGVMDMAGNVWEWCLTAYETGSVEIDDGAQRVVRGGSWRDGQGDVRTVYRYLAHPTDRRYDIGFRIACASPI